MKSAATAKKWIAQMARPYVGRIILLSLISGVSAASTVVFALLSQQVIDRAIGGESFWLPGVLLISVLAARVLLSVWYVYLNNWVSGKMEMSIKDRVFTALFRKQWQDVNAYHSGELLNRMTADSNVVVTGLVGTVPHVVSMVVSLIACLTVLFTVLADHGGYKYATVERAEKGMSDRFIRILSECVISIETVNNLIVVKTLSE